MISIALITLSLAHPNVLTDVERCAGEAVVERLAERCAQVLRAPTPRESRMWGPATLAVDRETHPVDMQALDQSLGASERGTSWTVWPIALKTPHGACVIRAFGPHGGFATHIRYDRAGAEQQSAPFARSPTCADRSTRRLMRALCRAVVERSAYDARANPPVPMQIALMGEAVRASIGQRVTPAQVASVFGPPSVAHADRTVHREPPDFNVHGARCAARARYAGGRLVALDLWHAPPRAPKATQAVEPSIEPTLERFERLCAQARRLPSERRRQAALALGFQDPDDYRPDTISLGAHHRLRLRHLRARYGAPVRLTVPYWPAESAPPLGDEHLTFYVRDADGAPMCGLHVGVRDGRPEASEPLLTIW